MDKKYKKFILILVFLILIGTLSSLIFIYKDYLIEKFITRPIEQSVETIIIYVDNKKLMEREDNFIYSSNLIPEFKIVVPDNIDIESITLEIDGSANVLMDEFYGETDLNKRNRTYSFRPSYMFSPQEHQVIVKYKKLTGNLISVTLSFVLIFQENFDKPLEQSSVWLVPEGRSLEWFSVQNGKLLASPITSDGHSSLAFLYPFTKNLTVDFELTSVEDNISLVFYFLDNRDFVIGSDSNNKMAIFRKGVPLLSNKEFKIISGHRYHVQIRREGKICQLAIKELFNEINPEKEFTKKEILLTDKDCVNQPGHIGFSLWQNSNGVLIDNVFIKGFSKYE